MSTKLIGDFGENIAAFLLTKQFEEQNLLVLRSGADNLPFDLFIPYACKGTPFCKPTAISVKTRGTWSDVIPPNKKDLVAADKVLREGGCEFWIGFIKYLINGVNVHFEVYMLPVSALDFNNDFKAVKRQVVEEQIITDNLKKKAVIKFISE